ncbi:hypothetical protein DI270_024660 [Microbispora triticiradicis]|uniref:Glycosyltransferase RgtA/B/C/D-like domain-containing protein n=1 Tax=Microbispora triticiradicis TaxID=2200763 RepID=A0ABX9LEH5_9ACTN|nr:hypothetical protein [Microbispora triticiradicis]RGA02379.1 hypothetical protein DI270_024660 [Microbispora triticiradicis]
MTPVEYIVVIAAAVLLVVVVHAGLKPRVAWRVLPVLLAAFAVRLAVHVLLMRSGLGYGGDNYSYEARALGIVELWHRNGVHYVTSDELGSVYGVAVPCHVFALVMYLCGGKAPLACTSVVASLGCGLCVVLYRFARLVGADERAAFRLLVLTAFLPGFLLHTSDMFKDGFNAFLVVTCLGLAVSNLRRFDPLKVAALGPLLWALWNVRPYMVFMCSLPLLAGAVRVKHALSGRSLVIFAVVLIPVLVLLQGFDQGLDQDGGPLGTMQAQLDRGQSQHTRLANAEGGSGVVFDDGGNAWSDLGPKLAYTLLSPFPWASGSMALQLGKIDTLLWYWLLFCAAQGARHLWRHDRRTLLILMLFLVPASIAYATTMSNIGLIFRQRIPIVMVTSLLSAIAWSRTRPYAGPPEERATDPEAPGSLIRGT